MRQERIGWIDIAKGLGIVLVTLLHTRLFETRFGWWASSFHIPLFFVLFGLCYDESRYPDIRMYIRRKAVALLYPYFAMSLFVGAMFALLCFDNGIRFEALFRHGIVNRYAYGPMWFLTCLFFTEVIIALFFLCSSRGGGALICAIVGYKLSNTSLEMPYMMRQLPCAMFCISFYWIGWFARSIVRNVMAAKREQIIAVVCFMISALLFVIAPKQYVLGTMKTGNPLWFVLVATSGSFFIVGLSISIEKMSFMASALKWLGRNFLAIFCLHGAVGACAATWGEGFYVKMLEYGLLVLLVWLVSEPLHFLVSPDKPAVGERHA